MANNKYFDSWIDKYWQLSPLGNSWVCYKLGPNSEDFQAIFHQEILRQFQSLFLKFQVQLQHSLLVL